MQMFLLLVYIALLSRALVDSRMIVTGYCLTFFTIIQTLDKCKKVWTKQLNFRQRSNIQSQKISDIHIVFKLKISENFRQSTSSKIYIQKIVWIWL